MCTGWALRALLQICIQSLPSTLCIFPKGESFILYVNANGWQCCERNSFHWKPNNKIFVNLLLWQWLQTRSETTLPQSSYPASADFLVFWLTWMLIVFLAIFKKSGPCTMSESFAYMPPDHAEKLCSASRVKSWPKRCIYESQHRSFRLKAQPEAPKKILWYL